MKQFITICMVLSISLTAFAQTNSSLRYSDKVDVGGHKLSISCLGEGSPTVIIEGGFGSAPVEDSFWRFIILRVAAKTNNRICVYDRAGLGSSDPVPTESRTSQDVVNDLHALLTNANITPPYVLVGHSLGGFHIRLYTDQYPDEVAGMMLIDATHPDFAIEQLAFLPPETPEEIEDFTLLRNWLTNLDSTDNPENFSIEASMSQIRNLRSLSDLPLVVLTRSPSCKPDLSLPLEIEEKRKQLWQRLQADLASLSKNSTHLIAKTACHDIQMDEPQLVIDAILKIVSEVQKEE